MPCWRSSSNGCFYFISKWSIRTLLFNLEITTYDIEGGVVIELVDSTLIGSLVSAVDVRIAFAHDKYAIETLPPVFVRPPSSYRCAGVEETCKGGADGSYAAPFLLTPPRCHG